MSNNKRNEAESSSAEIEKASTQKMSGSNIFKLGGLSRKATYLKRHWWLIGVIALLSLGALGASLKYLESEAQRVVRVRAQASPLDPRQETLLSKVNPFLPAAPPPPALQLSKEYIYAGSRLLAVEDASAAANATRPPADLAIWRPSIGVWWVMGGTGSQQTSIQWGIGTDIPVPGDYDGDGKTDFSVFRPSEGNWYAQSSANPANYLVYQFGLSGDKPVPADYDGDGLTDAAVYRPSEGRWYIRKSSDSTSYSLAFGIASDIPAPADFDGDGRADLAFYRGGEGKFYYLRSSQNNGAFQSISFGTNGDVPTPGDYDGDGTADVAVWRAASWSVLYSATGATEVFTWGDPSGDIWVGNDYDGDGKMDRAFWRRATGDWYIVNSSNGVFRQVHWGQNGDVPVPSFYQR